VRNKLDNVTELHYDKEMKIRSKVGNVVKAAIEAYENNKVLYHSHAELRESQRDINRAEVEQAIRSGSHIKKRDQFDEVHKCWKYCIEGKTLDKRKIRVVLTIDDDGLMVITIFEI
jgi:hypothetical protein